MTPVRSRAVFQICFVLLLISTTAIAQNTIHVPADQPTIRAAMNAAAPGDTVLVAPGTYVENINFNGKAITVTSSDGAAATIIDNYDTLGSVVTFNHNKTADAVLNGFTIRSGIATYGAGIYITGASPKITNNVITGNRGTSGVGIYADNGSPTIQGNTVTGNVQSSGSGAGCAIYITAADGVIANVRVIGNVVTNNHLDAGSEGGGICVDYFASALIQNNYIAGNSAYNGGGLFAGSHATTIIVGNVIANNSTGAGDGGGFSDRNSGPLLFLNNTLYGNSARNGTSEIATSIYQLNSTFKNNIVYATSGTAITCPAPNPGTSSVITATNNIVYGVGPATSGNCAAFAESNGNTFAEPGMVDPAGGDFHLHDGSPAIDAGASDSSLPPTDHNGTTRVLDGNSDGTSIVDIGAYEFVPGGAPAGWAVLAPLAATFPTTAPGSSAGPINFTLLNNGSAELTINSISINSAFAQTNNCPTILPVKAACLIQVTFTPTANGNFSGTLSVSTDGANGTVTAPLSGIGNGVFGTITPASLDFGAVLVGTDSNMQTLTLTNTGSAALVISSISVTGPFLTVTAGGCSPGMSIPPGASCGLGVVLHPATIGSFTGTLVINSNAAAITPAVINLSGSGDGPIISVSPTSLSFGTVAVGSSQTQVVTVSNTGARPLSIYSIQSSSNFAQTNDCGSTVAAGASCSINVTFTPSAAQQYTGTLMIDSNTVVGHTTKIVFLSGAGATPAISVYPLSIDFGQQPLGTSATQSVSISNSGSADLTISAINLSGADFQQTNNCPARLAPIQGCTVNLIFTPSSVGARNGSLTITHDAPDSPTTVTLTGNGTQPATAISPTSITFGSQVVGTSTPFQVVTVINNGTAPLNVISVLTAEPFSQGNNCSGTWLSPGASCSISVAFFPVSRGAWSGTLTINHNAPGSPSTVSLSGVGTVPVASVAPSTVAFGSQLVGTSSATQVVVLSNTGDGALSIAQSPLLGPSHR
jgi:hypothetical protein